MKERVDVSSDITFLIAQLRRLAASRLGKKLQLNELVFVDVQLAQAIIDVDSAVKLYGSKAVVEDWEALKRRVVRKAALREIKQLSESSLIFLAGAERGEREVDEE